MHPWNAYTLADIEAGTLTDYQRSLIRVRQARGEMRQVTERFASTFELRQTLSGLAIAMNEAFGKLAMGREPPDAA